MLSLWEAIRWMHTSVQTPSPDAVNYPDLILSVAAKQGNAQLPNESKNFYAFPYNHDVSIAAKCIDNPYLFSCIVKALIWTTPDRR